LLTKLFKELRRYLMAGLLIWLPLALTILIFLFLLRFADQALLLVPARYKEWLPPVPGLGALLAVLILLFTGFLGANLLGQRMVRFYENVMHRIPLVRSVYGAIKHFAEIVFSESGTSFKKVMLIEFPRKGLYSICFLTSEDVREVQERTEDDVITVFMPTTPNPTTGFMMFVARKDTIELDMSVEEALKMVISLGVVVPQWNNPHPDRPLARFSGRP
jgi:uncharacterized membrane protein